MMTVWQSFQESPVSIILTCAVLAAIWLKLRKDGRPPCPPGPKGLPFIGPALQFPRREEWKVFRQWCRDYNSDIIHVNILGNSLVILDKYETAVELMERRSSKYSSRPLVPMLDLMKLTDCNFGLQLYGETWRKGRRLFTDIIRQQTIPRFYPHIDKANSKLLFRLVHDPQNFERHTTIFGVGIVYLSTYGAEVDDSYLNGYEQLVGEVAAAAGPGAYLVNIIPILKHVPGWVPGAGFQRVAASYGERIRSQLVFGPYQTVKKRWAAGLTGSCFVSDALQAQSGSAVDLEIEHRIAAVASAIVLGGAETTSSTLRTFILAMVLYPEIQKTCFEELRRVCGPDRLPSYELDNELLPYFTATLMENLRWGIVLPLGGAHLNTEDDIYNGQYIPSGSAVIANLWSMTRDENVYPDPETFKPERFLKDGAIDKTIRDPRDIVFGFGRRVCPGRYLADVTTWTSTASIAATLECSKVPGVHDVVEWDCGLPQQRKPFKCSIKPRDASAANLIEHVVDQY